MKENVLKKIKGGLVVSCQARVGWAMHGSEIMAAFSVAAKEGGAVGIRATGADNIAAIKEKVDLPIIAINKLWFENCNVYITPTFESAKEVLDLGVEILAIDATPRTRPNNEKLTDIVNRIREEYPDALLMGEISTLDEAKSILPLNFDLISTTLCGYTENSLNEGTDNFKLIEDIVKITDIPVIAEGKIATPADSVKALQAGALAVVVGTSITRPEIITERFINEIKEYHVNG